MLKKNIALICNPRAGNGNALKVTDEIVSILKQKGIAFSIFTAYWPQVWDDFSEAWVIGGDGTLNYFINQYPHLELPLSLFKGGSGNDFHSMLYGNISIHEQTERVLQEILIVIDGGKCNDRLFVNGVGIGFDGEVAKYLDGRKKQSGKISYFYAILKNIFFYKEEEYKILFDTKEVTQRCFMISAANGRSYGGGFHVAPKASLQDGLLDLVIIGEISPLKRLFYVPVIEKGKHERLPFIQYQHTSKIIISSHVALPAHRDGEYFTANHFVIECLPKRFSFFV